MIERKVNENLFAYTKRVLLAVENKLINYEEMGNLLLEEENTYSEDNLRKAFYVLNKLFNKAEEEIYTDEEILKEINLAKFELNKERKKMQVANAMINEKARKEARADLMLEQMKTSIDDLKEVECKIYKISERTEQIGLLNLADIHYGKELCLKTFEGQIVNEYNPKIFEDRMWRLLNTMCVENFKYKKLVIFGLGDYIENMHRISTLNKLKYGFVDSVINFSNFMSTWLLELQRVLEVEVEFQLVGGNHDEIRPITNKSGDFPEEDSTKMIYEFIKLKTGENPFLTIKLANQICYYNFYGLSVVGEHGLGDIEKTLNHIEAYHGIDVDILITGHLHSRIEKAVGISNWLGDKLAIRVNSMVGACDYSHKIKKLSSAGCKFILFNEDGIELEKTYYLN